MTNFQFNIILSVIWNAALQATDSQFVAIGCLAMIALHSVTALISLNKDKQ